MLRPGRAGAREGSIEQVAGSGDETEALALYTLV